MTDYIAPGFPESLDLSYLYIVVTAQIPPSPCHVVAGITLAH